MMPWHAKTKLLATHHHHYRAGNAACNACQTTAHTQVTAHSLTNSTQTIKEMCRMAVAKFNPRFYLLLAHFLRRGWKTSAPFVAGEVDQTNC